MNREIRRAMPLLSISTVMQLTELTARQIRYYEEHHLIQPARTEGNRRMFSLDDIDALLEIRELLDQGINMAGIKKVFDMKKNNAAKITSNVSVTDADLRALLREEMMEAQRMQKSPLKQGDLPRFYNGKTSKL